MLERKFYGKGEKVMVSGLFKRSSAKIGEVAANADRGALRRKTWVWIWAVMVALIFVAPPAWAQDRDPLLEILIRKGVLTPEEADQVQKEAKDLEREKQKKAENKTEKQVENKVATSEQKVTTEVDQKVAAVEKKVDEKTASSWPAGLNPVLKGWSVGALWYLGYTVGDVPQFMGPKTTLHGQVVGRNNDGHIGVNKFYLERGYLTFEKEITPWLSARSTTDLTEYSSSAAKPDVEAGDWKIRQKYLYGEIRPGDAWIFTQVKGEFGLGHNPWHDWEESFYPYRVEGTIPIEREGVLNSADIGASIRGYFGGEFPNAKEVLGGTNYDGLYGSWHVGVYNGSGYHAVENNSNKPVEYRVSVRPLPDILPGFQATYFGLYGKGNSSSAANFGAPFYQYFPDWIVNLGHLSYQHPWFRVSAQIISTKGNQAGNWTTVPSGPAPIGDRADSLWTLGYSAFGDVKIPIALWSWGGDNKYPLHFMARMDWFNADQNHVIADDAKYTKLITGFGYYLYKENMVYVAYEKTWYGRDYAIQGGTGIDGSTNAVVSPGTNGSNLGTDQRLEVLLQLSY